MINLEENEIIKVPENLLMVIFLILTLHTIDIELTTIGITNCYINKPNNYCYLMEQNPLVRNAFIKKDIMYPFIDISIYLIIIAVISYIWKKDIGRMFALVIVVLHLFIVFGNCIALLYN